MSTHPTDDLLLDVVLGEADAATLRHTSTCPDCRQRLADAGSGLDLAREATVPEPPGMYWEAFRRRVAREIAQEPARRPGWLAGLRVWPALLAAAAALVVMVTLSRDPLSTPSPVPVAAATLPAWTALPPIEDDLGFEVLTAYAATRDELPLTGCDLAECLAGLSEEESDGLVAALRQELHGGQS